MIEINERYIEGMVERFKKPLRITDKPVPKLEKISKYLGLEGLK